MKKVLSLAFLFSLFLAMPLSAQSTVDESNPQQPADPAAAANLPPVVSAPEQSNQVVRAYAITDVLERIQELDPNVNAVDFLLNNLPGASAAGARVVNNQLVLRCSQEEHQQLAELLSVWREHGVRQLSLRVRFISTNLKMIESVDWIANTIENKSSEESQYVSLAAKVSEKQLENLVKLMQAEPRNNILQAPRVTMFSGQSVQISDCIERPYVGGYKLDSAGGLEPVTKTASDGVKFDIKAIHQLDGSFQIVGSVRYSKLLELKKAKLPLPHPELENENLILEVPQVATAHFACDTTLQPSEHMLICVPTVYGKDEEKKSNEVLVFAISPSSQSEQ
jgi:hypothetical protein